MAELPLIAEWQRVTHRLLEALDGALGDLGLSAGEVNALACFAGADSLGVRELLAATGQRASTLTGVLDRLERRGLIARAPDPRDRRALRVELTRDGRRVRTRVQRAFADVERGLPSRRRARELLAAVEAAVG